MGPAAPRRVGPLFENWLGVTQIFYSLQPPHEASTDKGNVERHCERLEGGGKPADNKSLLSCLAMSYGGAFEPTANPEREQHYLRYYGKPMPFISRVMLMLQDDPKKTRDFYKSHLSQAVENAAFRKVQTSLPIKDENGMSKTSRNREYRQAKAKLDAQPKIGSPAYYLKQCE